MPFALHYATLCVIQYDELTAGIFDRRTEPNCRRIRAAVNGARVNARTIIYSDERRKKEGGRGGEGRDRVTSSINSRRNRRFHRRPRNELGFSLAVRA